MSELDSLLDGICRECADLVNASASSIFLREDEKFIMRAAFGYSELLVGKASYKLGEGITGFIGEGNSFMANSDEEIRAHSKWVGKYNNEQWGGKERSCHGIIGIPLISDQVIIGLIKVENKSQGKFTEEDKRTLKIFARTATIAIETKKELIKKIKGLYIFILMPFSSKFNDIYEFGIKQTISKLEMHCERVDERHFTRNISQEIYRCIEKSNFIIADMTGRNPNVFYEVGYAHALRKEVILLTQNGEDIPFDFKDMNHIIYDNNIKLLSTKLEERLKALLNF